MLSFLLTSTLHCVTNFIIISGKHYYLWSPGAAADILEVKNASLVYCWTWLRAMVGVEAWSASSTSVSTLPIFITTATINIIRWLLSLYSPPLLFQWEYSIVLEKIFWNWYYQLCALSSFRDLGLASSSFLLGSKTQLTIYWLSNITKHLFTDNITRMTELWTILSTICEKTQFHVLSTSDHCNTGTQCISSF